MPLDARVCKFCEMNVVESEAHVLLECPLYDDLRHDLILSFCNSIPDFLDFNLSDRLSCILCDKRNVKMVAKICRLVLNRRANFFLPF